MKPTTLNVALGPKVCEFADFPDWARTSSARYRNSGYRSDQLVRVDAVGWVIGDRLDDMRSAAFPVAVYGLLAARKFPESHYQDTWRAAHSGARTDWGFIGEHAREAWRDGVDTKSLDRKDD